jgi:hypothetical protein
VDVVKYHSGIQVVPALNIQKEVVLFLLVNPLDVLVVFGMRVLIMMETDIVTLHRMRIQLISLLEKMISKFKKKVRN